MTGDIISSLQVDNSASKPTNVDSFYVLLDKLTQQPPKEGYVAPSTSNPLINTLKASAIIAIFVFVLSLPQVQSVASKHVDNVYARTFALAGIIFILSFLIMKYAI
jgi:hypothetical protein